MCSWNLENFGRSKTDSAIQFMAANLKDFDVVAVVEVVAGVGGAQAVARLADELNRKGSKWDYCISDPTISTPGSTERYAFLWKTSRLKKMGDAVLEKKYQTSIEREPYIATFAFGDKQFSIAAFHAVPRDKHPETEIKYLQFIPQEYPDKTILFCGDFNCSESNQVFNPLKTLNYPPALVHQRTSLKMKCKGDTCLANEYDNVFYPKQKIHFIESGVIHFYKGFSNMKAARKISDHLPVYFKFSLN